MEPHGRSPAPGHAVGSCAPVWGAVTPLSLRSEDKPRGRGGATLDPSARHTGSRWGRIVKNEDGFDTFDSTVQIAVTRGKDGKVQLADSRSRALLIVLNG